VGLFSVSKLDLAVVLSWLAEVVVADSPEIDAAVGLLTAQAVVHLVHLVAVKR
jgi:hypothetical protein